MWRWTSGEQVNRCAGVRALVGDGQGVWLDIEKQLEVPTSCADLGDFKNRKLPGKLPDSIFSESEYTSHHRHLTFR